MEYNFFDNFSKRKPFTVTQITGYIKGVLTEDVLLAELVVEGEISNCKLHTSGHLYFTLKDSQAAMSAVMFKRSAEGLKFTPRDGVKVRCSGRISVYEKTGQYQLYAEYMEPLGKGRLYADFERLKSALSAEGLFDAARKQPIPSFPKTVAVVTSPTGAAVRDIINVIKRRAPGVNIVISPAIVQGAGSAESIAGAIGLVNEWGGADVLIVGRGGGSIEDLWAFNEEIVARAVFASKTPVISAVGHETDFTITDFVADLRAPTPSAAAELAVYNLYEAYRELESFFYTLKRRIAENIGNSAKNAALLEHSLAMAVSRQLTKKQSETENLIGRLSALSPLNILSRGFAYITGEDGARKTSVNHFQNGESVTMTLNDGCIKALVYEIGEETAL